MTNATTTAVNTSARAVLQRFLAANEVLDVDGMFQEIGRDAVWLFPTAPAGAPRTVSGKETNRQFFDSIRPMWATFDLTFTDVHALAGDDSRVVAHYASEGTLIDGSHYANSYLSLVTVEDGKIVRWIEFCDPAPLERGVAVLFGDGAA